MDNLHTIIVIQRKYSKPRGHIEKIMIKKSSSLKCRKYFLFDSSSSSDPKFWSVTLYLSPLPRTNFWSRWPFWFFFIKFWIFDNISYLTLLTLVILNFGPFRSISYRFWELAIFTKFRTHDLEVYSPYYDFAHLLYIGHIDAKFEPTRCSYWDMPRTK